MSPGMWVHVILRQGVYISLDIHIPPPLPQEVPFHLLFYFSLPFSSILLAIDHIFSPIIDNSYFWDPRSRRQNETIKKITFHIDFWVTSSILIQIRIQDSKWNGSNRSGSSSLDKQFFFTERKRNDGQKNIPSMI